MARETKQDRIIRNILDQVTEHLHELKDLESNPNSKELDVERWAQSFLRNCLGYSASTGYSIRAQEAKGKMRPDLVVFMGEKPMFVVEVKKMGFDLNKSDFRCGKVQLNEYLKMVGNVRWGILTNGIEWKLFDFSQPQYGGIEVASFDLKAESDTIDVSKKAVEEQAYEFFDFHESNFATESWMELSKEAQAFSPDSLAKAILSADVVKYIARFVRGEHEFKANHEMLTDRLYWLLEQGLNDAIQGWNETKAAEIHKYVKSQKRAARKVKKSRKDTTSDSTAAAVDASAVTTASPTPDNQSDDSKAS